MTLRALAASAALLLCTALALAAQPLPGVKHVVVIGVDGLSPAGIDFAHTPVLNDLIRDGSYTFKARAVFPTSSSSNWMSMISGAGPELHGVTGNDWQRDDGSVVPVETGIEGMYPTIFSRLRAARPDAKIVVVHDWDGFARLFEHSACDVALQRDSAAATTSTAIEHIKTLKPTLTFIHLDHVDGAGHGSGWESGPYLQAVTLADTYIGQVVAALKDAGMWDSTILIITSDHGGVARSHGGESMAEIEIPWIIHGPGIAKSRRILASVNTIDTAAMVARALGFTLAPSALGRPVEQALATSPEGPGQSVTTPYIPAPRISPRSARLVDESGAVTLTSEVDGAEIRYTIDGSTPTASSPLYSAPIPIARSTGLTAATFTAEGQSQPVTANYRVLTTTPGKGASFEVFAGHFNLVPNFTGLSVAKRGTSPEIDFEDLSIPVESFAARFKATLNLETAGTYKFWTESDDGSRLFIDGKSVVNNDGDHGPRLRSGEVKLSPGPHTVEVTYFNSTGSGVLRVYMAAPGGKRELLDNSKLTPSPY